MNVDLLAQMEKERWNPPVKHPPSDLPVSFTSPECSESRAHSFCAADILDCPKCQAYSEQRRAELASK